MDSSLKVLVVEDNDSLRNELVSLLAEHKFNADGVYCAEDICAQTQLKDTEIYIVDLNLPGEDGLSLTQRLRATQPAAGIIMMTVRDRIADRALGYATGADIYLPKPVDPDELVAAIHALGRRVRLPHTAESAVLERGKLMLRGPTGAVKVTVDECRLLVAFCLAKDATLESSQVAVQLQCAGDDINRASMVVRLSKLRKKFKDVGVSDHAIRAIRKYGYQLFCTLRLS